MAGVTKTRKSHATVERELAELWRKIRQVRDELKKDAESDNQMIENSTTGFDYLYTGRRDGLQMAVDKLDGILDL